MKSKVNNSPLKRGDSEAGGVFKTYKKLPFNPALKSKAKELRKAENLSEVLFWNQVKKKQLMGLDFHRQKIIGNYIVDFYCPEMNLIIEIDGESHNYKVDYDTKRELYLKSLNLEIIHYNDIDIKKNLNSVIENLKEFLMNKWNTPPFGHPSKRGE